MPYILKRMEYFPVKILASDKTHEFISSFKNYDHYRRIKKISLNSSTKEKTTITILLNCIELNETTINYVY
jgi:hypothetical protein